MRLKKSLLWCVPLIVVVSSLMIMSFDKKRADQGRPMQDIILKSDDFIDGKRLPVDLTCDGKNVSPHLSWGNDITQAKSFSIVCDDPDAPSKTWVHWVVFNIPVSVNSLARGASGQELLPGGVIQGINDFGKVQYGGACPPHGHGTHRYFFKIYALDIMLDLTAQATKADVEQAMQGHVVGIGQIVGTYSRE